LALALAPPKAPGTSAGAEREKRGAGGGYVRP
jgi:hypothetical protein